MPVCLMSSKNPGTSLRLFVGKKMPCVFKVKAGFVRYPEVSFVLIYGCFQK